MATQTSDEPVPDASSGEIPEEVPVPTEQSTEATEPADEPMEQTPSDQQVEETQEVAPTEVQESAPTEVPESAQIEVPESAQIGVPESAQIEVPESAQIEVQESAPTEVQESAPTEIQESAQIEVQDSQECVPIEEGSLEASKALEIAVEGQPQTQEETTTIQVVIEVPPDQQVQVATEETPQDAVENEMILMAEAAEIAAASASIAQHPDEEVSFNMKTPVKHMVTINGSQGTQQMEVDPPAESPRESPIPPSTPPTTGTQQIQITPGHYATPPATFDAGTPVTTISASLITHEFRTPDEDGAMPMMLERAESEVSYVIPFDQQSLMSSTIGSPGIRKCGICGKVYRNRNGLYKHRLAKHPQLVNANKPIHCQQQGCTFDCHRLEVLREHITEVHKIPMQLQLGTFANMADFIIWKERLEKENCANFVKTRGASGNTQGVNTKHRYYCSRSGFHNSKSTGKRRKVTTKMGAYCTAGINVLEHKTTGEVQAEACITHHGHPIQLEYLKIPNKDKREIAGKIVKGKDWKNILAEYHESGLKQGTRSSILTKKDLMNIKRVVGKHLPDSEHGTMEEINQQIEIDTSDPNWLPPPSATCSDTETEIAVESLQRLGEIATTGVAVLRDGLLMDLDNVAKGCNTCQDRDSLMAAGSHIKAALNVFQVQNPAATTIEVLTGGSSRTRPVRSASKTPVKGASVVVTTTQIANAAGDGTLVPVQGVIDGQTIPVEVGENAMNLLESMEKDGTSDVRVPAPDSQEGDDDMPVITYRLVPAGAENATCPLDSLATTSQYRTLGIRLTKEMLYTLSLICEKHQMDRLLSGGNLINREEVEIICSKLPDEVIDADMTSIRVLLERDAWYLLESAVEHKRTDWKCGLCDKVTGKLHMIRCCSCNNWFHWVCVEIEEQPTEEWFCPGCILRRRMQAIQTKQPTKKVAVQP